MKFKSVLLLLLVLSVAGIAGIAGMAAGATVLEGAAFQTASGHTASFTWSASPDGGTATLYRAPAACSTNPTTFTPLQTGLPAGGPGSDATVTAGAWCYYVTALKQGLESVPSNKITITVLPQPPTGLSGSAN